MQMYQHIISSVCAVTATDVTIYLHVCSSIHMENAYRAQILPALYGLVQEIDWLEFLNDLEYHLILWEEQP